MDALAVSRMFIEGWLAVLMGFVLFFGSVFMLLGAIFGWRMGYLLTATGLFGFMLLLSALWAFGAPGTPRFLGPKGQLPHWVGLAAGRSLQAEAYPIERYPAEPWTAPGEVPALTAEVEPVTLAVQEFLAEEANRELRRQGVPGEVAPEDFAVQDIRFATVEGTQLAVARAFAETGGPLVLVAAYKDPGNEPLPSYLFLIASAIGFAAHLPFLDRAERRRREVLTGGEQAPWRGPA